MDGQRIVIVGVGVLTLCLIALAKYLGDMPLSEVRVNMDHLRNVLALLGVIAVFAYVYIASHLERQGKL